MAPQTFSELVTFASMLIALVALVASAIRMHDDEQRGDQAMRDRLDSIKETVDKTQSTLDKIDAKLDDHNDRIARIEEQIKTLFNKVGAMEYTISNSDACKASSQQNKKLL